MLPATRGAEVLYINVVRPALGNVKSRVQSSNSSVASNPFQKDGFNAAGTTAPSSFERECPPFSCEGEPWTRITEEQTATWRKSRTGRTGIMWEDADP